VLSHPTDLPVEAVLALKPLGLGGIEVHHPDHSPEVAPAGARSRAGTDWWRPAGRIFMEPIRWSRIEYSARSWRRRTPGGAAGGAGAAEARGMTPARRIREERLANTAGLMETVTLELLQRI